MYQRQNNKQNQNIGNPNQDIRKEIEAENALSKIGNEAANQIGDLPNDTNEANNALLGNNSPDDNEERIDHYLENDLNHYRSKKRRRKNKNNGAGNDNILNIIDAVNEKDEPLIIDNEPAPGKKVFQKIKKGGSPGNSGRSYTDRPIPGADPGLGFRCRREAGEKTQAEEKAELWIEVSQLGGVLFRKNDR